MGIAQGARVGQIKESLQWLDRYLGPVGQGPRPN